MVINYFFPREVQHNECSIPGVPYLLLPLEDNHSASFIPGGQQLPRWVKLHRWDNVSCNTGKQSGEMVRRGVGENVSAWTWTKQKTEKKKAVKVSVRQKGAGRGLERKPGRWILKRICGTGSGVSLGEPAQNSLSDTDAPVRYKYGLGEMTGWLTAWYRAIQTRLIEASQSGSLNCAPVFFFPFFLFSRANYHSPLTPCCSVVPQLLQNTHSQPPYSPLYARDTQPHHVSVSVAHIHLSGGAAASSRCSTLKENFTVWNFRV